MVMNNGGWRIDAEWLIGSRRWSGLMMAHQTIVRGEGGLGGGGGDRWSQGAGCSPWEIKRSFMIQVEVFGYEAVVWVLIDRAWFSPLQLNLFFLFLNFVLMISFARNASFLNCFPPPQGRYYAYYTNYLTTTHRLFSLLQQIQLCTIQI